MSDLNLLIRVDATHEIGLAHAVRSGRLVGNLSTQPTAIVAGHDTALLRPHFGRARYTDIDEFVRAGTRPDAYLIDCPVLNLDFCLKRADGTAIPVIVIDDYGGQIGADLIINGTVLDDYHRYSGLPDGAQLLCGADYALIDPVFANSPWCGPGKENALTIVAGGGNRAASWVHELVDCEQELKIFGPINLIVGQSFPEFEKLAAKTDGSSLRLYKGINATEMAGLLSNSSVALVTGGMIVYEALAVGVPTIVFPQEMNLVKEAEWFAQQNCICNLGYEGGMEMPLVGDTIRHLIDNPAMAVTYSQNARATIDGRGMERAALAIDDYLLRTRSA
jgi:spore coat polysaccharide biosynthesis predicted glycosyltransferase SpsG